jgi:hypothetical protein
MQRRRKFVLYPAHWVGGPLWFKSVTLTGSADTCNDILAPMRDKCLFMLSALIVSLSRIVFSNTAVGQPQCLSCVVIVILGMNVDFPLLRDPFTWVLGADFLFKTGNDKKLYSLSADCGVSRAANVKFG